jgi:hypothetical protein
VRRSFDATTVCTKGGLKKKQLERELGSRNPPWHSCSCSTSFLQAPLPSLKNGKKKKKKQRRKPDENFF